MLVPLADEVSSNEMKVGILTYHRAENYGALLQAYALREYLKRQGYDVDFVDYWPDYHKDYFRIFPRKKFATGGLVAKALSVYWATVWALPRYRRKRVMQDFMKRFLGVSGPAKYASDKDVCREFDTVVFGSDQIWRQQNLPTHKGLDLWYFGSPNIEARKVAYAGSTGPIDLSDKERELFKQYLSAFDRLSVRESSLKDLLDSMGLTSTLVVDPVFLLGKQPWLELAAMSSKHATYKQKKYILFYNLLNSKEAARFAEKLSREKKLPMIEITKRFGFRYVGKRFSHYASVPDFLSLIENAEFVVSNSFHGVALSVILGKQFYAIGMGKRSGRVESLLAALGIEERYLANGEMPAGEIDYNQVEERLACYAEQSRDFLEEALETPEA